MSTRTRSLRFELPTGIEMRARSKHQESMVGVAGRMNFPQPTESPAKAAMKGITEYSQSWRCRMPRSCKRPSFTQQNEVEKKYRMKNGKGLS